MKRFKNILFFADGTRTPGPAFRRAVRLAEANGARLTVIDVLPESHSPATVGDRVLVEIDRLRREDRETELDGLIAPFREGGAVINRHVVTGIAFVEVIRAVIGEGYDLVIKSARPPDSFAQRTLGSTDLHLLRKCPCPVWIERVETEGPYRTVLAVVDTREAADAESARLVLELARSLAEGEGANLAVVETWTFEGEELLRSDRSGLSNDEVESLVNEAEACRRRGLDALLGDYGMTADDHRVHLIKGDSAPTVRALSSALGADLVVMGTLDRWGIPGVLIGSAAEDLLQLTQASVLAIKPYGFVSPVAAS